MVVDDIFSTLNQSQRKAVCHFRGPALVLSGPGSGKTKVITHRIAYLIKEKNIPTNQILAVTFTNKAAGEMKERVALLLNFQPRVRRPSQEKAEGLPIMGTFHSICAKILRSDGSFLGLGPNFLIFDEDDSLSLIKGIMKSLDIDTKNSSPSAVKALIESAKNELIGPEEYGSLAQGFFQQNIVTKVYDLYQKSLLKQNVVDFEDLLMKTVLLFQKNRQLLEKYQGRWKFILVDEYQDTNHVQYIFTKLLSASHHNIFVVGDASQAIYSWRGADFRNVLNFSQDFPDSKIFNLEQNYRSTKKILEAASALISQNRSHPILKLWTENPSGEHIILYEAPNELDEANFVTRIIKRTVGGNVSYQDFAVLYRTNAQSRVVEEVFLREGIPYVLIGGVRFYERREIKDILAYLRLTANPTDSVSYSRVINVPPRGIGPMTLKTGGDKIEKFGQLLTSIREKSKNLATLGIIDNIVSSIDYLGWLNDGSPEAEARIENVKELRSVAMEFPDLTSFLENVTLVEREYQTEKPSLKKGPKDAVTLMTAHAAKGLEFPEVFIIGLEEGLFPHSRSLLDSNELEEERRLMFVGITRAKNQLYLTYATKRLYFGQTSEGIPSRFISEIPAGIITSII